MAMEREPARLASSVARVSCGACVSKRGMLVGDGDLKD